jgi:hypothetical protein
MPWRAIWQPCDEHGTPDAFAVEVADREFGMDRGRLVPLPHRDRLTSTTASTRAGLRGCCVVRAGGGDTAGHDPASRSTRGTPIASRRKKDAVERLTAADLPR